ncbi:8451_t:CDS:2, partial [Racocetra fulgida]
DVLEGKSGYLVGNKLDDEIRIGDNISRRTKSQHKLEDMIQQEGEEESESFTEQSGRLNLSNNQEIEDIEKNIEPLFLPRKKRRTHASIQLNLPNEDSTDEDLTGKSSDEEFEELNNKLNEKLVNQFNNESGEESVEEVAELDEGSAEASMEESADEWLPQD